MKFKVIIMSVLFICSVLSGFIFAHDKVVVIPLDSGENDSSRPIYDVPHRTMTIDGYFADWSAQRRFNLDINAGDCNNAPGREIRYLYITQDDDYIYLRMTFNGALDPTFRPKFGHGQLHVRITPPPFPTLTLSSPICGGPFPNGLLAFGATGTESIEIRFDKCDVAIWHTDKLEAWNDQDNPSVCGYSTDDFPIFNIDFSRCGF